MIGQALTTLGAELVPGERTVVERPPPGFGRGLYQTDAPLVLLAAGMLVLGALAYYLVRVREKRRP
jgi:hypothetical protein